MSHPFPFLPPAFPPLSLGAGKYQSLSCLLHGGWAQLNTQTQQGVPLPCACSKTRQGRGNNSLAALLLLSPSQLSPASAQPGWLWSLLTHPPLPNNGESSSSRQGTGGEIFKSPLWIFKSTQSLLQQDLPALVEAKEVGSRSAIVPAVQVAAFITRLGKTWIRS